MNRNIFLPVVVCLLACAHCRAQEVSSATQPETLRVLSYNIHMWQTGPGELAKIVRAANVDIVGLNEAWDAHQIKELSRTLKFNVVYGGQRSRQTYPPKSHTISGFYMPQVLLTKHRVVESHVFNAMAAKENEDFDPRVPIYRGGTLSILETDKGNRLAVFVLHLHPWGDGSSEKMTNMRLNEIEGILGTLNRYRTLPQIILGDFNSQPHRAVSGGWKVTRRLEEAGFVDTFRDCHADWKRYPGHTCGETRIDYIFHTPDLRSVDSKVLTQGVFGSRGYQQSDHLAVFGELTIGLSTAE